MLILLDGEIVKEVKSSFIDVGFGYEQDYENVDCKGKIVLVNSSFPPTRKPIHRSYKYGYAIKNGAVGFVQYHDQAGGLKGVGSVSLDLSKGKIPALSISYEDYKTILRNKNDSALKIKSNSFFGKLDSYNSIALKNNESNEEIVVCGHQDCWFNSVGAYDNGSGISMVLELARHFSKIKLKRNIRFIGFGSEELGSYWFRKILRKIK